MFKLREELTITCVFPLCKLKIIHCFSYGRSTTTTNISKEYISDRKAVQVMGITNNNKCFSFMQVKNYSLFFLW